jgi:hypothetical protein
MIVRRIVKSIVSRRVRTKRKETYLLACLLKCEGTLCDWRMLAELWCWRTWRGRGSPRGAKVKPKTSAALVAGKGIGTKSVEGKGRSSLIVDVGQLLGVFRPLQPFGQSYSSDNHIQGQ